LAAIAHVVAAIYSLTLPHTAPTSRGQQFSVAALLGYDAIRMLRQPAFGVLILATMLIAVSVQFYLGYANLFLNNLGVSGAAGKLAFGQVVELGCILLLPLAIARLGVKTVFLAGAATWALRYALLSAGDAHARMWMLYAAILLHGICYTFVYLTAQVFVDRVAGRSVRASAQGLFTLLAMGVGHFTGGLASGWAQAHYLTPAGADPAPYDWGSFWLVPCVLSLFPILLVATRFSDAPTETPSVAANGANSLSSAGGRQSVG
jgi:hypothetical protein